MPYLKIKNMRLPISKNYLPGLFILFLFLNACKPTPQKLSESEVKDFARQLEESIKRGNGDFLDEALDEDAFLEHMKLPDTREARGLRKEIKGKLDIGKKIAGAISDQDQYAYVKHYQKDGTYHLIFRLYNTKESSLNYHDYELLKSEGKCRVADIYIYLSGETLAETMRTLLAGFFNAKGKEEDDYMRQMNSLQEIKRLMQRGQHADAKKRFEQLPESIRRTKPVMLYDVMISSGLAEDQYTEAIRKYRERFPSDPNINLLMIDGYYLQKDYVKMLGAINALDSQINKDPFLDFYRYLSYNLLNETPTGKGYLQRLMKRMPDFQRGCQELIVTEMQDKNQAQVDSLVKLYRANKKFNQAELDNILSTFD